MISVRFVQNNCPKISVVFQFFWKLIENFSENNISSISCQKHFSEFNRSPTRFSKYFLNAELECPSSNLVFEQVRPSNGFIFGMLYTIFRIKGCGDGGRRPTYNFWTKKLLTQQIVYHSIGNFSDGPNLFECSENILILRFTVRLFCEMANLWAIF